MWELRVAPARRRARVRRNLGAGRLRRPLLRVFGVVLSDDAATRGECSLHRGFLRSSRLGHDPSAGLAQPPHARLGGFRSHAPNHRCRITRAESRVWPLAKLPPGPSSRKSMLRTFWGLSFETTVRLSDVGAADAHPGVAHLLIVYLRIVDHHIEAQPLHRQSAYGGEQRVRSHYAIMLRGHQSNARIDEFLLRIENVQRCTLADAGFFTHTVERDLCRIDLRRRGFDLGFQLCTTVARA